LKTTAFGLTSHAPDCAVLVVGANMGLKRMAREHLCLASALGIPVAVVITKTDMCPVHVLKQTRQTVLKALRGAGKTTLVVKGEAQVAAAIEGMATRKVAPLLMVSSVDGQGLPELRQLFAAIPSLMAPPPPSALAATTSDGPSAPETTEAEPAQATKQTEKQLRKQKQSERAQARCVVAIDGVFSVPGVGAGVSHRAVPPQCPLTPCLNCCSGGRPRPRRNTAHLPRPLLHPGARPCGQLDTNNREINRVQSLRCRVGRGRPSVHLRRAVA
jgi:hypothetical protein